MYFYNFLFCMAFFLFSPVFSDEDYVQVTACCTFKGVSFKDVEYILTDHYNKKTMMRYNSTRGNWTGYTPYAIQLAKHRNSDPYDALQRVFEKKTLCRDNIDLLQHSDNLTAAPTVTLNSVKHPSMLVCSAYNFYPKQIRVTWLRNSQEVTSHVTFSEVMSDGDWYYQIHSYLEHTPASGEKITCMVEHLALSKPLLQVWDPSLPASERVKIVVGLCGLMLGLVIASSGFIYYKKKCAAHFTLYQGRESIPVEHLHAAEVT
uniref:rano class II histocompatibility antigen, A beta chain-like isoform X2 n=1 Tax=Scatophagus argus TaxID=75038 RepID=UPI001ED81A65|nr:rano class II histocompatibility antigen, A beta chain-like isoform X2 [Scatophagus argus]